MSEPAHVYAATSSHLNFQARLMSNSGSIVPDGFYNVEFNLYSVSSGGTSEWTESRTGASKVRVVNGYLSVGLGEVTAFPGTVNWDQDHWLTMNIGGSGAPVWDGEMTPRLKLTAVPYAFQAKQSEVLTKTTGGNTGILDFLALTANRNINLPDQNGTLCIQGSADCVDVSTTGDTGLASSNSGLEISGDGLRLLGGCADGQSLRWNETTKVWECASGGSSIAVRESDGTPSVSATTLEFGPASGSDSEFIITNQGSGVSRVRLGTGVLTLSNYAATLDGLYVNESQSPAAGDISGSFAAGLSVNSVQNNSVDLGVDTVGDYVASLGTLVGLSTTGNTGEGSTPGLSVLYGSAANTAVQGNTQLTCASGTGNLTGGGTVLTLGSGGTCGAISTNNAVSFSTSVTTPVVTSAGALTVSSTGTNALTLDSGTTGAINLGTGASAKTITIGNATGATSLVLNSGTGAINIGTNAVAHTTTIGNATGASSVIVNCGTGACSFGASATAHTTTIGSNTGAATTTIQAGTGGLVLGNGGIANTIQIGNLSGAAVQNINIGTNATAGSTANLVLGSTVGASTTTLQAGTGGVVLNASTLKRTAAGLTTFDLTDSSSTGLALINSGAGVANFTTDGSITAATGLTVSAGGAAITGNSTITGTLTGLTGLTSSGSVTFSGLGAGLVQSSAGGVLSSGAVDRNSLTFFNTALNVTNGGTGAASFTANGIVFGNGTGALQTTAAGTTGQCLVAATGSAPAWGSCAGAGSGVSLQSAYTGGGTITTTDAKDLSFTLADTATDSSFLVNIATGSTGKFAIQNNGTDVLRVTSAGTVVNSGGLAVSAGGASIAGTVTLGSLNAAGVVHTNASGQLSTGAVVLGTDTSGDYVANLGSLAGLSVSGNSGAGSTPGLSVLYGSGANNAAAGSNTFTCASGTGNLTGGGTVVTIGTSGTVCGAITTNAAVSFATSVTSPVFTGLGAVTLSSGGSSGLTLDSASGTLSLAANDTMLQRIATGIYTIDLNDTAATTLRLTNNGTGVANLDLAEGGLSTGSTLRLSNGGTLQNITGLTIISGGASITGNSTITGTLGVSSQLYVPGTSGTSAQGYFTGSSTTPLAGFQSLDLAGSTYSFFGTNKRYDGTSWVDNGLGRTGSSFQLQNDSFTFYSFDTAANFTPRFTVASGGNVGIGLSGAPAGLLSVGGTVGNFQVSSAGAVTSTSLTTGAGLVQTTGTGAALILDRTDGVIASLKSGLAKSGFFFDNSGSFSIATDTRGNISSGTGAGTDILTALANGNVGIGTSGPDSRLHVIGGVCIEAADSGCVAGAGTLTVGAGLSLVSDAGTNISGLRFGSALDANLYRSAANTLKTDGDFIAGRIGIGVASPQRELHIDGMIRVDRNANSAGLMLHRTGLKTFFFGVDATGANNGEFFISDFGSATSGASTRRFSINNAGQVSIGAATANDALDVAGAIDATGGYKDNGIAGVDVAACTAGQYIGNGVRISGGLVTAGTCRNDASGLSDARLKKDVNSVGSTLDKLGDLRVISFNFKVDEMPELNLDRGLQYGVIAQELEQIFPELVSQRVDGYKEVNFQGLSFYNLKAVSEIAKHLNSSGDANLNNVTAGNLTVNGVFEAGTIRADHIEGLEYNGRFESLEQRVNALEQHSTGTGGQSQSSEIDLSNLSVGKLTTTGAVTFKNTVTYEQGANIGGDIIVNGETDVQQMTVQLGLIAKGSLEVNGPATFNEVARFKKDVRFDGQINVLGYTNVQGMTVNLDLIVQGSLEVRGPATFKEMVRFEKDVQFDSNVAVKGQATFSSDTAGVAVVKAGETSIKVSFSKPKTAKPVISLTLGDGKFAQYSYKNVTETDFEIVLAAPAGEDLAISWLAISADQPVAATEAP